MSLDRLIPDRALVLGPVNGGRVLAGPDKADWECMGWWIRQAQGIRKGNDSTHLSFSVLAAETILAKSALTS